MISAKQFQSTLPVWGATIKHDFLREDEPYFNPRSPCGERLDYLLALSVDDLFQSTLPVWGATVHRRVDGVLEGISIHAPRVGSDSKYAQKYTCAFVT